MLSSFNPFNYKNNYKNNFLFFLIFITLLSSLPGSFFSGNIAFSDTLIPGNPYGEAWECHVIQGRWSCAGLIPNPSPGVLSKQAQIQAQTQTQSHILGWIPDTHDEEIINSNLTTCHLCGGYYYEPNFPELNDEKPLADSVSKVLSNQKDYTIGGPINLNGNVKITQPGRQITADHVTLYPAPEDPSHVEKIQADGSVRIRQPGHMLYGAHLTANLYDYQATLDQAYYLLSVQPDWANSPKKTSPPNFTGYAHGSAYVLHQLSETLFEFDHATYTTSTPDDPAWHLFASKIILNKQTERGHADNMVLFIGKVPVFYFPYFSFPLSKQRSSGFLYGDFSSSGGTGFTLSLPYYFNLAPNYDDTLTPEIMSKRGIMLDNEFRYLASNTQGKFNANYLNKDQETHTDRWLVNYQQTTRLNNFWHMNINYNQVSDADYFKDFIQNNAIESNQTTLDREINLTSNNNNNWSAGAYIRNYQIVDPTLELGNRPYNTLPELDFTTQRSIFSIQHGALNINLTSQITNFQKDEISNQPGPLEGLRTSVRPTASLPLTEPYGYFTPAVSLQGTTYSLSNTQANNYSQNNPSMLDPIFDIDTGLYFDRSFGLLGKNYEQTLSPRLFYLYIPYRDQNNFPSFDSSIIQFSYDALFNTNRFNGLDRLGDANQLTYAITSSLNNQNGQTLLDMGLGQITYFTNRRVSLCQSSSSYNCLPSENPDYNRAFSDTAGQVNAWLSQTLKVHYDFAFDQDNHMFDLQNYQLQYLPDPQHIFNIGFESNRTDYALLSNEQLLAGARPPMLSQITTSFLWQVTPFWNVLGSWNYSTNQKRIIDTFAGIEYSPCSWAVRLIWHRYLINQDVNDPNGLDGPSTSTIAVQFELKGLGNLGSSKIEYLARQIPGYQPASGFSP